ncbi:MAG: hypothetical protein QOJ45_1385 [Verrucomicrobiota bacterium]|jgi:hypothetical protein
MPYAIAMNLLLSIGLQRVTGGWQNWRSKILPVPGISPSHFRNERITPLISPRRSLPVAGHCGRGWGVEVDAGSGAARLRHPPSLKLRAPALVANISTLAFSPFLVLIRRPEPFRAGVCRRLVRRLSSRAGLREPVLFCPRAKFSLAMTRVFNHLFTGYSPGLRVRIPCVYLPDGNYLSTST